MKHEHFMNQSNMKQKEQELGKMETNYQYLEHNDNERWSLRN